MILSARPTDAYAEQPVTQTVQEFAADSLAWFVFNDVIKRATYHFLRQRGLYG